MADLTLAYATRTSSTGIPGRAITSARNHHLVADDAGGEELGAGELFLGGIGVRAVNMVGRIARSEGIALGWMEVVVDAYRDSGKPPGDITVLDRMTVDFQLWGVSQEQAEYLVDQWKRR